MLKNVFAQIFETPMGSKVDLQTDFGDIFYTILDRFEACVSLDSPKLSGKDEI